MLYLHALLDREWERERERGDKLTNDEWVDSFEYIEFGRLHTYCIEVWIVDRRREVIWHLRSFFFYVLLCRMYVGIYEHKRKLIDSFSFHDHIDTL